MCLRPYGASQQSGAGLEQVCIVYAGRRNPDTHVSGTERWQPPVVLQLQRRSKLRAHGGGGQAPRAAAPQCAAASHASDNAHGSRVARRHHGAKLEPGGGNWRTCDSRCAAVSEKKHLCLQSAVSATRRRRPTWWRGTRGACTRGSRPRRRRRSGRGRARVERATWVRAMLPADVRACVAGLQAVAHARSRPAYYVVHARTHAHAQAS